MRRQSTFRRLTCIFALQGSLGLLAQESSASVDEGFHHFVVLKTGMTSGNLSTDLNSHSVFEYALQTRTNLRSGRLLLELGYTFHPGLEKDRMRTSGTVCFNPAAPSTQKDPNNPYRLSPKSSVDDRKNTFEGFVMRAAYEMRLGGVLGNDIYGHAGLGISRYKARQEAVGTLRVVYGADSPTSTTGGTLADPKELIYEGIYQTPEATKIGIEPFVGASMAIGERYHLQVDLRSVAYPQVNWMPWTYTGQTAHAEVTNRRGFSAVVGFGLKL